MDAGGSHPRKLTGSEGLADWGPDWSPDGEWIAWNTAPDTPTYFDLGVIHPDGTDRRVIKPGVYVEYPAWSPDRPPDRLHESRGGVSVRHLRDER
jgi:TolB protein